MRLWPSVTCDHITINYLMSFYLGIGRENRCSPGIHRKLAFQYKKHIQKQILHCYYLPYARKFQGEMSHVEQFLERDSEQQFEGRPRWGWEREPATCPWCGLYWLRGYWEAVLNLKRWVLWGRRQATLCRACWVASTWPKVWPQSREQEPRALLEPQEPRLLHHDGSVPVTIPTEVVASAYTEATISWNTQDSPHLTQKRWQDSSKFHGPEVAKWWCEKMQDARQMFSQAVSCWLEPHSPGILIHLGGGGHH